MLVSIQWLKDYLLKSDIEIDVSTLSQDLTMVGLAVASIRKTTPGFDNVVVGKIEKIEKHPNADRLQITFVKTEENAPLRQIVCGATNISEGDIVPVALPGAVLPGNLVIKESAIRGTLSQGMLCSAKELHVADDAEGILQLPKHSEIGKPLGNLLGVSSDTVIELELTPNRSDCLSMLGVAREVAPMLHTKLKEPKVTKFRVTPHRTSSIVTVEVSDKTICPRYVARVIDTLKVSESPDWIKQRLSSIGIRPINNVVDITNFVMYEYGQPLHAFDLRRIESGVLRVVRATHEQDFTLLSGDTIKILEGDILIQDGDKPVALAGIMGGLNSQIEETTTSILLESAAFDPIQIRKTAKRLGLSTESSKRFEKGVDPIGVALASERAASLFRDIFNSNVYHPPLDTQDDVPNFTPITIDMREIKKLSGLFSLTSEQVSSLLDEVGIETHKKSSNILTVKIPSFRRDLREGIDIVEEVTRLYGYENIPETYPLSVSAYILEDEPHFKFEEHLRKLLVGMGLCETVHYSFISQKKLSQYGFNTEENSIRIKNPISEEFEIMRTSLLPSLSETFLFNKNRKALSHRIFEIAKTYHPSTSSETSTEEWLFVSGLLYESKESNHWKKPSSHLDFYYVKGLIENILGQLNLTDLRFEPSKGHNFFHPAFSACLFFKDMWLGTLGEAHPFLREQIFEIDDPLLAFELNLQPLLNYKKMGKIKFQSLSKFPSSEFDIAMIFDKSIPSEHILNEAKVASKEYLNQIYIFDVFEGGNLPFGSRSLGIRFSLNSKEKTLTDNEVKDVREKAINHLSEKFNAKLRA